MLTLALDTTTRAGSVAILRGDEVLTVVAGDGALTHAERLPAEIAQALRTAALRASDLDLLVVASGPGAFTGLRIGLAAVQGMAMVLGTPVIAVSALDALALFAMVELARIGQAEETVTRAGPAGSPPPRPLIATWMDAQRGEVFAAHYELPDRLSATTIPTSISDPVVAAPDVVWRSLPPDRPVVFVGDGASKYSTQILRDQGARHPVIAAPAMLAQFLAQLGMRRAARGEAGRPHALQPLYVRRPDAELERMRREAR